MRALESYLARAAVRARLLPRVPPASSTNPARKRHPRSDTAADSRFRPTLLTRQHGNTHG